MTTGEVLAWVAPSVVAGAVGWQAIRDWFVRPRVYRAYRAQNLVTLGDTERRKRIETILTEQGEPTALVEVEWWNSGRLASANTRVTVDVPGTVVSFETVENREAKTTPPVQHRIQGTSAVEVEKASLNPRGRCRLVVGFTPNRTEDISGVSVLAYQGNSEIAEYRPGGGLGGLGALASFIFIAAALAVPVWVAKAMTGLRPSWLPGTAAFGSMFLIFGLGLAYTNWITKSGAGAPSWTPTRRPR